MQKAIQKMVSIFHVEQTFLAALFILRILIIVGEKCFLMGKKRANYYLIENIPFLTKPSENSIIAIAAFPHNNTSRQIQAVSAILLRVILLKKKICLTIITLRMLQKCYLLHLKVIISACLGGNDNFSVKLSLKEIP